MSDNQPSTGLPSVIESGEGWLEPFDWYAEMLAERPLRFDSEHNRWDVFSYDLVKKLLNDHTVYRSDHMETTKQTPETLLETTLLNTDPPEHRQLRSTIDGTFRPDAINDLQPRIEQLVNELLDSALEAQEFDLVHELAGPLPSKVIATILGLPPEDWRQLREWSRAIVVGARDFDSPEELRQTQQRTQREITAYLRSHLDKGLNSGLLAYLDRQSSLSEREVLETSAIVLVSGNLTTTNLISNTVRCLVNNYNSFDEMPKKRSTLNNVVEETLRYRSPSQNVTRVTSEATTLGEKKIHEGSLVMAWIGAANRDPSVFTDPNEFRPGRQSNAHIAFGAGVHMCPGSVLARLETVTALEKLFGRIESLEIAETELQPTTSAQIYGVRELPIRVRTR